MLKDTGERLIINDKWEQKTITEHLHRYQMVAAFLKGDHRVLDAACGTGYGSHILSQHAGQVFGIDISADAINYAQNRYKNENLCYSQMSVAKLDFPDNYFDVIISFETIEHVDRQTQSAFLREIKRCLKPEGILVMSTPDDELLRKMTKGAYFNEYHIAEFTQEEFRDFLQSEFAYVTLYYQNISEVSSILKEGINRGNFDCSVVESENKIGRYYMAVCSNVAQTEYPNDSVFIPSIADYYNETFFEQRAILYVDCGEGFTGDLCVVARSEVKDVYKFRYCFDVKDFKDIKAFRFDPCEKSCRVKIEKMESDKGVISFHPLNHSEQSGETDVFYDVDPMYLAEGPDLTGVQHVIVEGSLEEIPLQTAFSHVQGEIRCVQAQLDDTCNVLSVTRQVLTDTAMVRDQKIAEVEELTQKLLVSDQEVQSSQYRCGELQEELEAAKIRLSDTEQVLAKKVAEADGLRADLQTASASLTQKTAEAQQKADELYMCGQSIHALEGRCRDLENQIHAVFTSRRMKLINALFMPVDLLKRGLRKIKNCRYVALTVKALRYWKHYGTKSLFRKIRMFLLNRRRLEPAKNFAPSRTAIPFAEVTRLPSLNKKIAVQLHLYYEDLAEEFIGYLDRIPYHFDLFISCRSSADRSDIEKKFKKIRNVGSVIVKATQNRGRDIAPVYVLFREELMKYDYFAHIHSKKSLYSGRERRGWRQYALDCMMGSPETVERIFSLFEGEHAIGLFSPETFDDVPMIANTWLSNEHIGKAFLNELGISFDKPYFNYPVGSFFWAKTEALLPVFQRQLTYMDFPEEAGQTDGTLAHVLERAIAIVAQHRGYQLAFYDPDHEVVQIGQSNKYLQPYFSLTTDAVQYHLGQYDIVTFDIFDTLLTRRILHPDDIFGLIGAKVEQELGLKLDFLSVRKRAEAIAWEKHHARCSIHEIYRELEKVLDISASVADRIKQIEIETEKELLIPRKDMRKVYEHLLKDKVRIILISDMYLPKAVLEEILNGCGYYGWEDLWVSCDVGARKDDGSMWNLFFEKYGEFATVHVGDHPRSDGQLLLDRGRAFFPVLSSWALYTLSDLYEKLSVYDTGTIENSIVLGTVINEGLFNSPFALDEDANPTKADPETLGFAWVGPMFAKFARWLTEIDAQDTGLIFLAREGYILQKAYSQYCAAAECEGLPNSYFLTSRRAASVAGIRTEEDLREVVNQYYNGSLKNYLQARFGIQDETIGEDQMLSMPRDEAFIMDYLHRREGFKEQIERERNVYLQYAQSLREQMNVHRFIAVDVGYSGTIQFYLSRMLEEVIDGYYLSTGVNKKPLKIGCKCEAIYPVDTVEATTTSKIFASQLFLEAVLQAPYGQLINFTCEDGVAVGHFKKDNVVPETVTQIQNGLLRFVEVYGKLVKTNTRSDISAQLAEDLLYYVPISGCLSDKIVQELLVQDDYCSNGNQRFDAKNKKWIVVKN